MSTYLVAIVVGEFDFIEDTTPDGIRVRVYTPVGKQEQGQFALEVAVKVLPYYKDYFKMPYPLPKMDLIAIGSFAAGKLFSFWFTNHSVRLCGRLSKCFLCFI